MQSVEPIKIFICYAREDLPLRNKLEEHLSQLKYKRKINIWQDQEIVPGTNWNKDIQVHLKDADIILLLVSSSFIASAYCWNDEVQKALERHRAGLVQVIPIILRPVYWQCTPLEELQALPTDARPVTMWDNQDAALENVVQGLLTAMEKLQSTRQIGHKDKREAYENNKLNGIQKEEWQATNNHFRSDARYIIGVDIDRSHLTILLTDLQANIINEASATSFNTSAGAVACLKRVAVELQTLLEKSNVTWEQIVGIGLATPGPLDRNLRKVVSVSQNIFSGSQNVVHSASQMPGWEGIDILDYMEHKLKKKIPIYLDNDANMGALGESRYGAGRGVKDLVYVKIGMGIGAGIITNGGLLHGSTGAAGELGHIAVKGKKKDKICTCGNHGCLEIVAAEPAIIRDAHEGISLHASYPDSAQNSILAGHIDKIGIEEVIQAAENGDEASQLALKRAGEWIGIALGTIINLFNPSMILLDGDVIRKTDFLFESLQHSAQESCLHATWIEVQIGACKLEKPVAIGAVANVIDHLK